MKYEISVSANCSGRGGQYLNSFIRGGGGETTYDPCRFEVQRQKVGNSNRIYALESGRG